MSSGSPLLARKKSIKKDTSGTRSAAAVSKSLEGSTCVFPLCSGAATMKPWLASVSHSWKDWVLIAW